MGLCFPGGVLASRPAPALKSGREGTNRALTLSRFAEGWWEESHSYVQGRLARGHQLTATCLVVMRGHLHNHILPFLGDKRISQITARQIEEWLLSLRHRGDLSPSTINHALRCLKIILKEAVRQNVISRDPSVLITGFAVQAAERGILTGPEIRGLFYEQQIDKVWDGDRKHFCLNLIAASTGLRMGECQGLAVGSVHSGYLTISQSWERRTGLKEGTKTGVGRLVPLPSKTARYLDILIETALYKDPVDLVFYGQD